MKKNNKLSLLLNQLQLQQFEEGNDGYTSLNEEFLTRIRGGLVNQNNSCDNRGCTNESCSNSTCTNDTNSNTTCTNTNCTNSSCYS